jgi:hypothetical protein
MINLEPKEAKTHPFTFTVDKTAAPGDYGFTVGVYQNGQIKGTFFGAFTVVDNPVIEEKKEAISGFLQKEVILTKKNVGNAPAVHRIEISSSFFKRLFTSTQPETTFESGKMVWERTLQPGEEFTVHIVYNYRSIF